MHTTARTSKRATYPLTIHTPFGLLRMTYELDLVPCSECGQYHGSVSVLDASARLKKPEAEEFLGVLLPQLLGSAGDLAFLHCLTSSTSTAASVGGLA